MNLDVIEQHCCKVSWRKVMDLPQEKEKKETHDEQEEETREGEEITSSDDDDEDLMDCPKQLLAPGPTNNQIVIFQRQGCM